MIDETGCDAVMIGRASLGNPWIFKEVNEYLEKGIVIDKPSSVDRVDMCLKHFKYLVDLKIDKVAVLEIRNHIAWYLKGIKGSNEIKNKVYMTKDINEIYNILMNYKKTLKEEI